MRKSYWLTASPLPHLKLQCCRYPSFMEYEQFLREFADTPPLIIVREKNSCVFLAHVKIIVLKIFCCFHLKCNSSSFHCFLKLLFIGKRWTALNNPLLFQIDLKFLIGLNIQLQHITTACNDPNYTFYYLTKFGTSNSWQVFMKYVFYIFLCSVRLPLCLNTFDWFQYHPPVGISFFLFLTTVPTKAILNKLSLLIVLWYPLLVGYHPPRTH